MHYPCNSDGCRATFRTEKGVTGHRKICPLYHIHQANRSTQAASRRQAALEYQKQKRAEAFQKARDAITAKHATEVSSKLYFQSTD